MILQDKHFYTIKAGPCAGKTGRCTIDPFKKGSTRPMMEFVGQGTYLDWLQGAELREATDMEELKWRRDNDEEVGQMKANYE